MRENRAFGQRNRGGRRSGDPGYHWRIGGKLPPRSASDLVHASGSVFQTIGNERGKVSASLAFGRRGCAKGASCPNDTSNYGLRPRACPRLTSAHRSRDVIL